MEFVTGDMRAKPCGQSTEKKAASIENESQAIQIQSCTQIRAVNLLKKKPHLSKTKVNLSKSSPEFNQRGDDEPR